MIVDAKKSWNNKSTKLTAIQKITFIISRKLFFMGSRGLILISSSTCFSECFELIDAVSKELLLTKLFLSRLELSLLFDWGSFSLFR